MGPGLGRVALGTTFDYTRTMSPSSSHWRRHAQILGLLLFMGLGCSSVAVQGDDPGQLFKQAEEEIASDHYLLATEHLKTIRNKFPYSQFAPLAQLRLADVYFLQESFAEAASAYETFRDLYPKHEKASYALFRAGKSYFKDSPSHVARDLGSATRSVATYREFLRRFPSDPLRPEAEKDLLEAEDLLAKKENYVAEFYRRQGQWKAARSRLESLLETFPNTPTAQAAKKTLEELKSR